MLDAFRAFMSELIDYAGLFPPASLDLDRAIRNYAGYRDSGDAWMLGRFVIPTGKLGELATYQDELFNDAEAPYRFSVLAGGGATEPDALARLRTDLAEIHAFIERHGGTVRVDSIESRLPADVFGADDAGRTARYAKSCALALAGAELGVADLFFEIGDPSSHEASVNAAVGGIADAGMELGEDKAAAAGGRLGLKLRCGGDEPEAFPSAARVAQVIAACDARWLPLKCTAGLHHPLRQRAAEVGVMSHGFLNVFGAGILLHAGWLDAEDVLVCIEDPDPGSFRFDIDSFAWRDDEIPAEEIGAARKRLMTSFGSCSFDEPRDDLRALGLLDTTDFVL